MNPISQIPTITHPVNDGETTVAEQFDATRMGEVALDQVVKAQSSAPQIVKRITELENCMWSLVTELMKYDSGSEVIDRAKLLLNNRLEIFDSSKELRK